MSEENVKAEEEEAKDVAAEAAEAACRLQRLQRLQGGCRGCKGDHENLCLNIVIKRNKCRYIIVRI